MSHLVVPCNAIDHLTAQKPAKTKKIQVPVNFVRKVDFANHATFHNKVSQGFPQTFETAERCIIYMSITTSRGFAVVEVIFVPTPISRSAQRPLEERKAGGPHTYKGKPPSFIQTTSESLCKGK